MTDNLDRFSGLLQEADQAFRQDVSYAVAVCNAARSIESKRQVWKLRLELREASKKAQIRCRKTSPFKCDAASPCGVGDCRFAEGDLSLLTIESPGSMLRPQQQSMGSYSLEGVLEPLRTLRSTS